MHTPAVVLFVMQLRSGERLLPQPIIYTVIAAVVWVGALYFFTEHNTSFAVSVE